MGLITTLRGLAEGERPLALQSWGWKQRAGMALVATLAATALLTAGGMAAVQWMELAASNPDGGRLCVCEAPSHPTQRWLVAVLRGRYAGPPLKCRCQGGGAELPHPEEGPPGARQGRLHPEEGAGSPFFFPGASGAIHSNHEEPSIYGARDSDYDVPSIHVKLGRATPATGPYALPPRPPPGSAEDSARRTAIIIISLILHLLLVGTAYKIVFVIWPMLLQRPPVRRIVNKGRNFIQQVREDSDGVYEWFVRRSTPRARRRVDRRGY